jgi:multiple sugar transport system substrate-binding protein
MSSRSIFLAFLMILAVGCNGLPFQVDSTDADVTPEVTQILAPPPTPTLTPSPLNEITPTGPVTLTVWLPLEFDPNSGTLSAELLKSRLEEFSLRRPGVRLDVRLKAVEGTGGLLDTLTAAGVAAPLALPDLVALPRPLMETAALKGLLHPLDGLIETLAAPDWYDYAHQLSRLQNTTFGLPFAGDALLLVYTPSSIEEPPQTWEQVLGLENPLLFPAADPQALTTLALYLSAGGAHQDDQGRPVLDAEILAQLLSFYQNGELTQVLPYWMTQYETFDQSWAGYMENPQGLNVAWLSRYLSAEAGEVEVSISNSEEDEAVDDRIAAALLPSPSGDPFTLANGWVLSLAGSQPTKQALAVELAEFLTESSYLAAWTQASGLMPPRSDALEGWDEGPAREIVRQVAVSAQIFPSADILSSLAPALQQATLQILKQQGEPFSLAQAAAAQLENP